MKILPPKVKKLFEIWKSRGFAGILNQVKEIARRSREKSDFSRWIELYKISAETRENLKNQIAGFAHKPLISIILPVYNTEEKWLRLCIESVIKQLYENWELCIADDNSPSPHVRQILEEYAAKDARIKTVFRAENGHISAASNSALSLAAGEFCVLLDHDDELTEDALFYVAKELNEFPDTSMIYSDEDMIDERGQRFYPKFKPDFSRDFFYSLNLITHLSAYRTDVLRAIGGFRVGLEGSQDYDLALRFIEQIDEKQIRHIPKILYHWRAIEGSVALSSDEKPYAHERARAALREHFERTGKAASVTRGLSQFHRVRYRLPENLPRVSLILPVNGIFEASEKSAAGFLEETDYPNLEIILARTGNLSRAESLNQAVSESSGEILCFVDAALSPLSKDWLKELTSFAIQEEIGAVGGKIIDKNETISGGAFIVGFDDLTGTAFENLPRETDRNLFRARVVNNFSAISANCMAVRREIFEEIGGFDAENLPDSLFDADFCLKLGERNLRVVFTPYAEFRQIEKSRGQIKPSAKETGFFKKRWQSVIECDPFYNPNLSLSGETFTIKI
jgi:glycosyltransferase involved in cell wall biosynthesis